MTQCKNLHSSDRDLLIWFHSQTIAVTTRQTKRAIGCYAKIYLGSPHETGAGVGAGGDPGGKGGAGGDGDLAQKMSSRCSVQFANFMSRACCLAQRSQA